MPTYDYRCKACKHEFEAFQNITDPVRRKCPSCGRLSLERLIGAGAGLIFKGSGFYVTDYKRDNSGGNGQGAKSDAKGKGEQKADSSGASSPED